MLRKELDNLEASQHQMVEWRISVYGRSPKEWNLLAHWVESNNLISPHLKWVIQVPRLYHILKENGDVQCFQDMLDNIFLPLFQVTRDPSLDPVLHRFLLNCVSGFDSVDNEDEDDSKDLESSPSDPCLWRQEENPAYSYYLYYMWANLYSLNKYRESKSLNTFDFRPHSGAIGSIDHLATAYLLSNGIAHGSNLKHCLPLQYLYYLSQVGIYVSPLGEHALYTDYSEALFLSFFKRGLNVSLSTDCPLQLHHTPEPLVEEYSLASQLYRLNVTDLSEIARNSVLQSGFPPTEKVKWIGADYWKPGVEGNTPSKTNIPQLRIAFRQSLLDGERELVTSCCSAKHDGLMALETESQTHHKSIQPTSTVLRKSINNVSSKPGLLRKRSSFAPSKN